MAGAHTHYNENCSDAEVREMQNLLLRHTSANLKQQAEDLCDLVADPDALEHLAFSIGGMLAQLDAVLDLNKAHDVDLSDEDVKWINYSLEQCMPASL